ncbi:DNA repair protein RadA [candidate division KSB1 bacterium]|nr:DNA repair protein RadA [candidate division KSB1 bacterium]NIR71407.1 DNA repair protein RadA [candidate division KSB1 bacterium]NIS26309.1 DNA repair protein RadA [candidate division KSB1 bacterium]NIT73072.1 DNA repair protein RadA [candidate division KSB1 bacterium]NIU26979.1 DNA repair protein RadA [candidate division KSB1 bacterium]
MSVKAKKDRVQYTCQSCGHVSPRWMGHCSECNEWNSYVEEVVPKKHAKTARQQSETPSVAVHLSDIDFKHQERISARSKEFNRVLGGGVVPGSVVLLGGDPGIGKSTLMLQEGVGLANEHFPVLFVSGEESIRQTKLRADRLGINSGHLYVLAETNMSEILARIEQLNPKLVIVDSIQTVYRPEFESSPGSISQVRNCAYEFIECAKKQNVPIFLVGHVTKEGYIAGPKVLEHMVDVLLQFEGDRDHFYRILRSIKNRFGSTREIGVFEMTQKGLEEVLNPSSLFLEQRKENVTGSCVICTMEGTRPFLVEIQALVSSANFGLPQRTATGIDNKRLSLLLAVLEKRVGLRIGGQDVFVNAAGGVRIDEPAADLGILVSIASSFKDQIVDPRAVIIGEVGLGGEIRTIPQIDKRIDEATKLGFKRAVIPKLSQKGIKSQSSLKISCVDNVEEALEEVLN